MIHPLLPIGIVLGFIGAFVLFAFVYFKVTGKPLLVYEPNGSPASAKDKSSKENTSTEELIKFVQNPNRQNFLAIRNRMVHSDAYEPYSDEFDQAVELSEQQKFTQARDVIQKGMRNLLLSPRAHHLLGFLYHKLGDEKSAQLEAVIADACIEGLLSTGDGSQQSPYLAIRTSDEYDLLEHLQKEFQQQSLMHEGDKHFDMVECKDGSKYWFDITEAYNSLSIVW